MALIRYPGSKEKLANDIFQFFPDEMSLPLWMDSNRWEYREPFFGAGAIGFRVLRLLPPSCNVWINDKDYGLVCLWQAVWNDLKGLCNKIQQFKPSVEHYEKFKDEDGRRDLHPLEVGFRRLALHQMSYSGLGVMSGGPIGGKTQGNKLYPINCRWSPENLIGNATDLNRILKKFPYLRISCGDFSSLIDDTPKAFIYLDPPYYEKGEQLYRYSLDDADHERLTGLLKTTKNKWILSYDDHSFIRRLYNWTSIVELKTIYTIARQNGDTRPKNKEILILSPGLASTEQPARAIAA